MVKPYEPAPFQALDRAPLAKGPVPAQMTPHAVASVLATTDMRTFNTGATRNTDTEKLDKLEVAWAAGLFDGEGSITYHAEGKRRKDGTRRVYPKLYMGNTDIRLCERFLAALGGLGKVRGPYGRFGREGQPVKPMYHWTATHAQAKAAAVLLIPLLSPEKRERVIAAYGEEEAS